MGVTVKDTFDSMVALASATATGTQTSTTLQDTTKAFTVNAYQSGSIEYYATIISGTGAGQQRKISSNTATTLTLTAAWTTTPDNTSVYVISQVATGWVNPSSQGPKFVVAAAGYTSSPNAFGTLGMAGLQNPNVCYATRTASATVGDSSMQFSQVINYSGSNYIFWCPLAKTNPANTSGVFPFLDFSTSGTALNFYCSGVGGYQNSNTYNLGKTFASGTTVVVKFETVNLTDGNSTQYVRQKLKVWQAGTTEPTNWDLTYNDYGISVNNPGNGAYGAAPIFTLSGSGSGTTTIYGNVVGGVITAGILSQTGYGAVFASAPTITITGGGGTGATATCTLDTDGHIASITITNGGSGYTNSPTLAFSGGGGTGATAILATDAFGYLRALKITNVGSGYTSAPTATITGTGTGASIRFCYNSVDQTINVYTTGTYRGIIARQNGTPTSNAYVDDYYEGTVNTTFGGGQLIAVNATGIYYSPSNWYKNGSTSVTTNNNGAYVKFGFTGGTLNLYCNQLTSSQKIRYSIDNGAWQTLTVANGSSIVSLASGLGTGTHQVIIYTLGNNYANDRWNTPVEALCITNYEIDTSETVSAPSSLFTKKLFVFGDSIAEGVSANADTSTNAVDTWVKPLAFALKAEYGQIAFGGTGFTSGNGTVPAFSTSYGLYSAGKSRLVSGLFDVQPDYILCEHGVNGTWTSLDAFNAWVNLRNAAPSAYLFQMIPFGQQSKVLFKGTNLSGNVTSATSTSLTATGASFGSIYANCANMVLIAISSAGVAQVRLISPSGSSGTTLQITSAWTTTPTNTYTYKVMTAYEYYKYAYPSDKKFFMLDLGTDIAIGLTGSGAATQQSNDKLHPLASYSNHLSAVLYGAMYTALNPSKKGGGRGSLSL
jgi:hypothetical protein